MKSKQLKKRQAKLAKLQEAREIEGLVMRSRFADQHWPPATLPEV